MSGSYIYHRVGEEDEEKLATNKPRVSRWKALRDTLIVLLAIWGFISLVRSLHIPLPNLHPRLEGCQCGNSIAEAMEMGCKYDSLAAAWLPEHCRDDELTAEFERSGDGPNGSWLYYKDTHHTEPMTVEEVAALGDQPEARFHMTGQWHKVHCLFYWRKEHRFRFNGKTVEPRSDTEAHIHHCGQIFMGETYGTVSGVVFNTNEE
ncbi:hypothetical protein ASPZODRAFT_147589 [Penicilliopsis zonata CBS 506.65]|uniref:Uncharacterized protein n=1 Tax=Penicilliopsis zonata CBS 506.65 TaxID=1073090 RepID=A0A1L9S548_9EURO|nr:hypothetical protein ASPZODRAFT_147589 [Penicilliopsis zonata CBS 506.65]OJJ42284.1 hypothetical protein ASPZODRAFT_147589 [Penicilliopsis zonata CBS 506.65]